MVTISVNAVIEASQNKVFIFSSLRHIASGLNAFDSVSIAHSFTNASRKINKFPTAGRMRFSRSMSLPGKRKNRTGYSAYLQKTPRAYRLATNGISLFREKFTVPHIVRSSVRQMFGEVTYRVWFSTMSGHHGRRYDPANEQVIDGKRRGASDLQARWHGTLQALRQ